MSRRGRERAGRRAETLAALFLQLKGYVILARRFAVPVGEVDLIARRNDLLIFVEVKRRLVADMALAALQPRQQLRIARAASIFLQQRPHLRHLGQRFDVIAIAPWRWPLHLEDVWRP
jgi:putative endonuclease